MATAASRLESAWPGMARVDESLSDGKADIAAFREVLKAGAASLADRFARNELVDNLVRERARLVDALLLRAWRHYLGTDVRRLGLVAVGGYGRGELHPCSDIDVMVLLPARSRVEQWRDPLQDFFTFLWDIGLEIGHSTRSVADCRREGRDDITVTTSLMESRLLSGPARLFEAMKKAVGPGAIWDVRAFFEAKLAEQVARHHRYDDTGYNLEPNVKGSPGGLRDTQMISWVAKRHFGTSTGEELVEHGFLTEDEVGSIRRGRSFLWKIRFALHTLTGRREDRLLFDHQVRLAEMLGFEDRSHTLAVEQMMQRYYRTVMAMSRLNEMLLQLFREAILLDPHTPATRLHDRFQLRHGSLEAVDEDVFRRHPPALLEVFLLRARTADVEDVSAETIRLIHRDLALIDDDFRADPANHELFLDIMRSGEGVTHELRRMNRYGVLGRYIPAFGRIVGRMQYDLFHAYTVDEHTLFVVSNLRRFALSRYNHEFPYCSEIMQSLPKPELAYIAALFHDIAKGRGGDHSELGAVDAEDFCRLHGLGPYDARLIAWLVKNHLVLSVTAQKKDISDPSVINDFARQVGDQLHLDYLYVLTVADVRGTNPKMWNSWKSSLFEEFYQQTTRALQRGLERPIDKDELILETQQAARALLDRRDLAGDRVDPVWAAFNDDYFLRHSAEEIAWHTEVLGSARANDAGAIVAVRERAERGGTFVMVYSTAANDTFARVTGALEELGLTILDARITSSRDGHSLDALQVLEATGEAITDPLRRDSIQAALTRALDDARKRPPEVTRRAPRAVRMFSTPTRVEFARDEANGRTIVELTAGDRPGLLCEIGKAFRDSDVAIHTARISTIGERAEDVFYVTDPNGEPLEPAACEALHARLMENVGNDPAQAGT